jgi:hypothetical protein
MKGFLMVAIALACLVESPRGTSIIGSRVCYGCSRLTQLLAKERMAVTWMHTAENHLTYQRSTPLKPLRGSKGSEGVKVALRFANRQES